MERTRVPKVYDASGKIVELPSREQLGTWQTQRRDLVQAPTEIKPTVVRTIRLHGSLRDPAHPGPYRVAGRTVAEAVKFLSRMVPTLRGARARVVGYDQALDLVRPGDETAELDLVPQLNGGKSGGVIQIVLGVVLIAAAVATIGTGLGFLTSALFSIGASLAIGGLLQLLKTPKKNFESNHYLGSPGNTVAIGTPIAILMGRRRVGGQIMAAITSATEVGLFNYAGVQQ